MATSSFPFTVPGDYTYDISKISVTGGEALLVKDSIATNYIENFNDATGLTFNPADIEIIGGSAAIKSPAPYTTSNPTIDLDLAIVSAIPTQLISAWNSFVATLTEAGGDEVRFVLSDDNGVSWKYWSGAAWVVSSGYAQSNSSTTINSNISTFPITLSGIKVRVYLHSNDGSTTPSIDNLVINYDDELYPITNPIIYPTTAINAASISAFVASIVSSGLDSVRFTISVDGVEYYWDTLDWVTSSGYAQTNTAAEINTNIDLLDLGSGALVMPIAYLHSNDGTTTPELSLIQLTYILAASPPDTIDTCVVWGYMFDLSGDPVEGVLVSAKLPSNTYYKDNILVGKNRLSTLTDVNGYWQLELIETENMSPNTTQYKFVFSGIGMGKTEYKSVPSISSIEYNDLV